MKEHLRQKREEIIWSLLNQQNFSMRDVGTMFNITNPTTVMRIYKRMPKGWKSPWIKNI
jgi:hypothetical protein